MATNANAVLHQAAVVAAVVREAEVSRSLRQALVLLDPLTRLPLHLHLHLVPLLAHQASAARYLEVHNLERHTVQLNLMK